MNALPPRVVCAALVLPGAAIPQVGELTADPMARKAVERRGVEAVLAAERALGREPKEQASNNPGFDVLSTSLGNPSIRIEVKARIAGSDTFIITRTEVLLALNAAPHHRLALVSVHPDGPHLLTRCVTSAMSSRVQTLMAQRLRRRPSALLGALLGGGSSEVLSDHDLMVVLR